MDGITEQQFPGNFMMDRSREIGRVTCTQSDIFCEEILHPEAATQAGMTFPMHGEFHTAKLRHPNTGTAQDLPEPLDFVKFTEAVRGIGGMLESLAQ